MKILKFYLLSIAAIFAIFSAGAQSVDDIISKHINAVGGKDVVSKLNSIHIEATMQVMGNEAPNTVTILNGKGYKSESDFQGQKIVQCVTDKGGWMVNPMAGAADPTAMQADELKNFKEQLYIGGPILNYAADGYKAELDGQEKVGSVNAYKIKLTSPDGIATNYYIDPTTYYLIKAVRHGNAMGQDVEISVTYSDFKKTDFGYTMANTVDTDFGGQFQLSATVKKVDINQPVDPKAFDMPAK
jgi:hypothetical protein